MNLLLVDDHNLFRSGLRLLLSDLDESIRFFEFDGIEQLPSLPQDEAIDLVLLDWHLRGSSGVQALETVRVTLPDTTVVVLSSEEDPVLIRQCIELGASGFIPKASTPEILIQSLRLILAGGIYLPPHFLGTGSGSTRMQSPNLPVDLVRRSLDKTRPKMSPRQLASLMLAIQGKSNKAIADELGVVEGTVKLHLSGAFRALGVSNRTEAVFAAAEQGLLAPLEKLG